MIGVIITAVISFISTNLDNIFILMVFFSQISAVMRKRHIIIGQYIGIIILLLISILGAYGLNLIPPQYTGLLGIVPIILGCIEWIKYKREKKSPVNQICEDEPSINIKLISNNYNFDENTIVTDTKKTTEQNDIKTNRIKTILSKLIHPAIINVLLVTIANGADNIGVYVPLFMKLDVLELMITLVIFLLLLAVWCYAGEKLSYFPVVKQTIQTYKNIIIPVVFITIGVFILFKSEIFITIKDLHF